MGIKCDQGTIMRLDSKFKERVAIEANREKKTAAENCQMLCKEDNRRKSGR